MKTDKVKDAFKKTLSASKDSSKEETTVSIESLNLSYLEASEAVKETDDLNEVVDSLEAISETFENIIGYVETTSTEEGLNDTTSGLLRVTVEGYNRQLGIETDETVSLESLKDTVKKMWEAIKKAIIAAYEAIQKQSKKLLDYISKFKVWREETEKKLKSKGLTTVDEIDSILFVSLEFYGKKGIDAVTSGIEELHGINKTINTNYLKATEKYFKAIQAPWNDRSLKENEDAKDIGDKLSKVKVDAELVLFDALENLDRKEVIGGKRFNVIRVKETRDFSLKVATLDQSEMKSTSSGNIKAPTEIELIKILIKSDLLISDYEDYKRSIDALFKARLDSFRKGDKLLKERASGKLSSAWDESLVKEAIRPVHKSVVGPIHEFSTHTMITARLVQRLVEASTK